jgi:hypothetical protein
VVLVLGLGDLDDVGHDLSELADGELGVLHDLNLAAEDTLAELDVANGNVNELQLGLTSGDDVALLVLLGLGSLATDLTGDDDLAADGTTGAAAGAAAGGVLGSATPGNRVAEALGAVGGALMGGLIGSAAERAANSGDGVEYVVRKRNGELVSVVQRDLVPLEVGARVLVIEGAQARIVPDYTVPEAGAAQPPAPGTATPPATTPQQPDEAPDLGIAPAQLLQELPGWMGDGPGLVLLRERSI